MREMVEEEDEEGEIEVSRRDWTMNLPLSRRAIVLLGDDDVQV